MSTYLVLCYKSAVGHGTIRDEVQQQVVSTGNNHVTVVSIEIGNHGRVNVGAVVDFQMVAATLRLQKKECYCKNSIA